MKIFTFITLAIIAGIGWFNWPVTAQLETSPEIMKKPISSVKIQQEVLQNTKANISQSKDEGSLVVKIKVASAKTKAEQAMIKEKNALQIADTLLSDIYNNQNIDLAYEKELLSYLKATNNEQVYQAIVENLKAANIGNESDDRLIEYGLSLLATIDSPRASELFFDFVTNANWQGSNAIYSVSKSILRLTQNSDHTNLVQQKFKQAEDDNPFISELATTIAHNAKVEQIDYLISYIDGESKNKSIVASRAMNEIKTESLVPHITRYLSDSTTKNVQNVALNALANMGQYEAASALITWSSKQPQSASEQIKTLFSVALSRSPSAKRAVEKELQFQEFASEKIKELIINISNDSK